MKNNYLILSILFLFIYYSCSTPNLEKEEFPLSEARRFFDNNATDLQMPSTTPVAKTFDINQNIIIPEWQKARYYSINFLDKIVDTYEVPLNTGNIIGGALLNTDHNCYEIANVRSYLIIQKLRRNRNHYYRSFVVTIIGKSTRNNREDFSYIGNHNSLHGFLVVSSLEGVIIDIFKYSNRNRIKVYLAKHNNSSVKHSGFRFIRCFATKSSYGNGEPGHCSSCGIETTVYCQYGDICENCLQSLEYLDEIVVTPRQERCDYCGLYEDECICNPFVCPICHMEPCECDNAQFSCPNCNSYGCNGECTYLGDGTGDDGDNDGDTNSQGDWWSSGHSYIIDSALRKHLTEEQINAIIAGSLFADSPEQQVPDSSHIHAMRAPNLTQEQCVNKMRNYFIRKIHSFIDEDNYGSLGEGLHCIQDAYSPAHKMKVWNGYSYQWIPHLFESVHIYSNAADKAIQATEAVYISITNSDFSESSLSSIFNNWLNQYLNEE